MRYFSALAAAAASVSLTVIGGSAIAKEKAEQPKVKKICRNELMSGRITPQRVCRPRQEPARTKEQSQAAPRGTGESNARGE